MPIEFIPEVFSANWLSFKIAVHEALAVNVFTSTERLGAFAAPVTKEAIFTWMANACRVKSPDYEPVSFPTNWFADLYDQGTGRVLNWYPGHSTTDEIKAALHTEGQMIALTHYDVSPAYGKVDTQFRIVKALMKMHLKAERISALLNDAIRRSVNSQTALNDVGRLLQHLSFDDYDLFVAAFHGNFNPSKLSPRYIDRHSTFEEYRENGRRYRANAPRPPYDSGFEEEG